MELLLSLLEPDELDGLDELPDSPEALLPESWPELVLLEGELLELPDEDGDELEPEVPDCELPWLPCEELSVLELLLELDELLLGLVPIGCCC